MAKLLSGTELVGYIKERQAKQVRTLRQAFRVFPKLAIIKSPEAGDVIDVYVRMKQRYGDDILIDTVVETVPEAEMQQAIERLNDDDSVHGIIVQLPLRHTDNVQALLDTIAPQKDVDGLGDQALFDSATAAAINWMMAGYGIDMKDKTITIIGNGKLVGAPLSRMWQASGLDVTVLDETTGDISTQVQASDIVVSATGVPRLVTAGMLAIGAVVVDAGTASENGVIVGDVEEAARERDDLKITPEKGGVGPLTIAMLFDHVIQAAQKTAETK